MFQHWMRSKGNYSCGEHSETSREYFALKVFHYEDNRLAHGIMTNIDLVGPALENRRLEPFASRVYMAFVAGRGAMPLNY